MQHLDEIIANATAAIEQADSLVALDEVHLGCLAPMNFQANRANGERLEELELEIDRVDPGPLDVREIDGLDHAPFGPDEASVCRRHPRRIPIQMEAAVRDRARGDRRTHCADIPRPWHSPVCCAGYR